MLLHQMFVLLVMVRGGDYYQMENVRIQILR